MKSYVIFSRAALMGAFFVITAGCFTNAESTNSIYEMERVSLSSAGKSPHSSEKVIVQKDAIFKKNNLRRPVGQKQQGGVSRTQVDSILARVEKVFVPEFEAQGLTLIAKNSWMDSEVNAYAEPDRRNFSRRIIVIQGGLARYEWMTEDALAMVACHEIGHHVGGKPNKATGLKFASEGQADYFASAKCFRQLFTDDENQEWLNQNKVSSVIEATCSKAHSTKEAGLACMRTASAGEVLARVLLEMTIDNAEEEFGQILDLPLSKITTPSMQKVRFTIEEDYPSNQCRLDTYYQGSLCDIDVADKMTTSSVQKGACTLAKNYSVGVRPACWFNENNYPIDK